MRSRWCRLILITTRLSSIFDLELTQVVDGTFCRVVSWYDNEWGFSNRMSDTAVVMSRLI